MRIGIFGGSFDPVHSEHINLARAAVECLSLDKLFVIPAHTPPHKRGKTLSDDQERMEMCRLAFADEEKIEVSDYEIARGGTSYTYLTCRHFKDTYAGAELFFLVGTDMLRDFPSWKNPESILEDATLAVCARAEKDGWIEKERAAFWERFHKDFALVSYNGADISSTKIRVLAGAGMRLVPFVCESVERYIQEKGLYEIPRAKQALALQKPARAAHSVRVAEVAAERAATLGISERKAVCAALFHDCAKDLPKESSLLQGFEVAREWGDIPPQVLHQFTGAFVAKNTFGIEDEEILDAIRFHTSGRANMTPLGALVFLADMVEEARDYDGVEVLRELFWKKEPTPRYCLYTCLQEALRRTIEYLEEKGERIYPLTKRAYAFYEDKK